MVHSRQGATIFTSGLSAKYRQLETDLVVPLAGSAVSDRVGAFPDGDLDLPLGDERPGDRGAEQIDAFVKGVHAEHREDEVADELLAEVVDVDLADAEQLGLFRAAGSSSSPWPRSAVKATTSAP